jgi:hypothetical protein
VLPTTRALALFIAPFLLVAWVILYLFPQHTARLWAWPIPATMTSFVLASAYLGGALFFLRAAGEREWHRLAHGFPPVALFSGLLGVATVLHWSKFSHGSPAFWIWAALYFAAPFLVLAALVANRRRAAPVDVAAPVPPAVRRVMAGVAALALGWGLVMFAVPSVVVPLWPWALTPLTARVLAAVFCLGSAGLGALRDARWSSLRLMVEVEVAMLALMLLGAARARRELDGGRPLAWPLLVGVVAMLAASAWLWWSQERRARMLHLHPVS